MLTHCVQGLPEEAPKHADSSSASRTGKRAAAAVVIGVETEDMPSSGKVLRSGKCVASVSGAA